MFNTKGEILGRYDAGGVTDFDLGGDGFAALVLPGSGGQTLVTVNAKGEELGRLALTGGVTDVSVRGKYVAFLAGSDLHHRRQEARTLVFHPGGRVCHAGPGLYSSDCP